MIDINDGMYSNKSAYRTAYLTVWQKPAVL